MLRSAILLVLLASGGPAVAGGGAFVPPLEAELGTAVISTRDGASLHATQWTVGLSWASGYHRPTPVDVSLGVIATRHAGTSMPGEVGDATGGFLELATRIHQGSQSRAWAGMRGELLGSEGVGVLGVAGRVSVEFWQGVSAYGRNGGVLGSLALSAWAELGIRERPDRSIAHTAAIGLGFRLPMVLIH